MNSVSSNKNDNTSFIVNKIFIKKKLNNENMISIIEEIWPILYNHDGISSVMSFKLADEDFLVSFFRPTPKMVSEASVIAFCAFKILSIDCTFVNCRF